MAHNDTYTDYRGRELSLAGLDDDERNLVQTLQRNAAATADWCKFSNFWSKSVAEFYAARRVSRAKAAKTLPYRIAQDLSSRIGLAAGMMRFPDYRDDLADLIRTRFKNRRQFCKKAKLSEAMLSHVLARRKHLALDTLTKALRRIGCQLHIVPTPEVSEPHARKRAAS
jgi:hypothetical protein